MFGNQNQYIIIIIWVTRSRGRENRMSFLDDPEMALVLVAQLLGSLGGQTHRSRGFLPLLYFEETNLVNSGT